VIQPFDVVAMDVQEVYAEKCRAALTRREPAIRDIFDVYYGTKQLDVDVFDPEFITMVKMKIAVPGNSPVDTTPERKEALVRQLGAELRPVLRPGDFHGFDFDEAVEIVYRLAKEVGN